MEGNAKCRHLKNLSIKGDFAPGVCLSEAPSNSMTPYLPLLHIVYVFQYTYSHRDGGEEGRVEPERRLEGQRVTKLGRKYQHG